MRHAPTPGGAPAPSPRPRIPSRPFSLASALTLAALVGIAVAGTPLTVSAQACTTPTVNAGAGPLCGTLDSVMVGGTAVRANVYRGIPYAQAPVGSLRWQPPQPLSAWQNTFQATTFGNSCPQPTGPGAFTGAEDCLYLNVWTPVAATGASKLPVMVFIHGGAFYFGSGATPIYNGSYLADSGNVVVVTLNYRLGALGFLTATLSGDTLEGNFGLLDQQMALQWVQQNIGAFGGNSNQVTLFGESAGAMSVGLHLFTMPTSNSLFDAAIMESNPMGYRYPDRTLARQNGAAFIDTLDAVDGDTATLDSAWLAALDLPIIMEAQERFDTLPALSQRLLQNGVPGGLPWAPVLDSVLVMRAPIEGYAATVTKRPFIFGTNRDEGVLFAAGEVGTMGAAEYGVLLVDLFGPLNANSITSYVDPATGQQPYRASGHAVTPGLDAPTSALADLLTDFIFNCGNLVAADSAVSGGGGTQNPPVYGYHFVQPPAFDLWLENDVCDVANGNVCHGYELPYVFRTLSIVAGMDSTAADTAQAEAASITAGDSALAHDMVRAWTNFAADPTVPPVSGWASYTPYKPSSGAGGTLYAWRYDATTQTTGAMEPTPLSVAANCTNLWFRMPPLDGSPATQAARAVREARTPPPGRSVSENGSR